MRIMEKKEPIKKPSEKCDRCGHMMGELSSCHLICPNCGMHLDCSDKGVVW